MEKVFVIEIAVEGGGECIYCTRTDGVWSYWAEGTTMDMDEADREFWRAFTTDPVSSLDLVLPKDWPNFTPIELNAEFLDWFRTAYEPARSNIPRELRRSQTRYRHPRWMQVLRLPGKLPETRARRPGTRQIRTEMPVKWIQLRLFNDDTGNL